MGFTIVRSDLVLIPLQSSLLDAAEAARAVKLVHRMGKVADRAIAYRVVFTRMSPALRERTAGDIERQFEMAEARGARCARCSALQPDGLTWAATCFQQRS
jgi:chromosome partitioning protein